MSESTFRSIISAEKLFKPLKQGDAPTCQCSVCQQISAYIEACATVGVIFDSRHSLTSLSCCDEADRAEEEKNKCLDGDCKSCKSVDFCFDNLSRRFENVEVNTVVKYVEYGDSQKGYCGEEREATKDCFINILANWLVKGLQRCGAGPKVHTHLMMKTQLEDTISNLRGAVRDSKDKLMIELDFAMGVLQQHPVNTAAMHWNKSQWPICSSIIRCSTSKVNSHLIGSLNASKKLMTPVAIRRSLEDALLGRKLVPEGEMACRPKTLLLESDGAESEFWSGLIWRQLPEMLNDMMAEHDWNLETVVWLKSVTSHGKGTPTF